MRGYNLSSRPKGVKAYNTDQLTADIRGLIHERGAQSALLAGHDWGGSVAWANGSHMAVEDAVSAQFRAEIPAFAKPTFERFRRARHSAQYFDPSGQPGPYRPPVHLRQCGSPVPASAWPAGSDRRRPTTLPAMIR